MRGTGDLYELDSLFGQLPGHHLVVEAGDLAAGLLPGVPGGNVQAFCDLAEQGQVQPGAEAGKAVLPVLQNERVSSTRAIS